MKQLRDTDRKRLHRQWRRRTQGRLALVLDNVQNPYNLGAILRTAAAYRVEHLWLAGSTPDPGAPGVRKLALGAERFLTWTRVATGSEAVEAARDGGLTAVAIELAEGAKPLHEVALGEATCLVLGHEDHGVAAATLAACDHVAYLPQLGRIGSLNVAAAAAIALYEARRREWTEADSHP